MMNIRFQSSVIFVQEIETSRYFYEELLGQEVEFDFGENVSFKVCHPKIFTTRHDSRGSGSTNFGTP